MIRLKPFPLQEKAIQKGLEVLTSKRSRKEVLVAPVAAGKSLIIAEIVERLPKDCNILVVQPNKELLVQNLEKIESLGVEVAVYSASLGRKEFGRVIYATPMSLKYEIFKDANIKYVIQDECDYASKSGSKFPKFLKSIKVDNVLGLTATPIYMNSGLDGSVLNIMTRTRGKFYRDICHVVSIDEVREINRWSELVYKSYEFDRTGLVLNSSGSDYTEESLRVNYVEADMDNKILGVLKTVPEDESILIFVPGIENAQNLSKKIEGSEFLHSGTSDKDRERIIKSFKSGELKRLVNCQILGVGFDYPELKHIVDGYPTNSARIYYQRLGRAVRVHENKKFATIHDLAGNVEKFGKIEDFNFENIENYGWGMFSKNILLTGVPMSDKLNITKEKLRAQKGIKKAEKGQTVHFVKDLDDMAFLKIISFGKHKGKTFRYVYENDKPYLLWLNSMRKKKEFDFSRCVWLEKELENSFY